MLPKLSSTECLLEKISSLSIYRAKFIKVKNLVESVLRQQMPDLQAVASEQHYFNDHGFDHIQRVESRLGALDKLLAYPLNEKEAFILLVATYVHDISMFVGRRENEDPEDTRREHHNRSVEVVQKWKNENKLDLSENELLIITYVILAHRKQTNLEDLPETQLLGNTNIRTQLLGALLRIADACDCDQSRAPRVIFDILYQQIPENSKPYWRAHFPVTGVSFDPRRSSVIISINFGQDLKGKIEKSRFGKLLKNEIELELESVDHVFLYNNIPLTRVEIKDFVHGNWIDFSLIPKYETYVKVNLKSGSDKIDEFVDIVTRFQSDNVEGIPLVIEISPPEGPLFIDANLKLDGNGLEEMNSELNITLGSDHLGIDIIEEKEIERITIMRGVISENG